MTNTTREDWLKALGDKNKAIFKLATQNAELLEALIDLRWAAKPDSAVFVYDKALKKADKAIRKSKSHEA